MNKKYAGLDFPAWFDGKDVNEAAFCREFLSKNKLIYADKTIMYNKLRKLKRAKKKT